MRVFELRKYVFLWLFMGLLLMSGAMMTCMNFAFNPQISCTDLNNETRVEDQSVDLENCIMNSN